MNSIDKKIVAPKHFKANNIISFINDCQIIFNQVKSGQGNVLLDLDKITECTMIGVLLIYKVIEFTMKFQCYAKGYYIMSPSFQVAMERYGFTSLILSYFDDKKVVEQEMAKLKVSVTERFIIAPQALLRNDKYSAELLNKNYLPKIEQYYSKNVKCVSMIFTCFSEVLLNFWEHAIDDTHSIIVANGNKTNLEIGCADNGKGVISTLSLAGKEQKSKIATLISATKKGVTSKDMSNHMGYGLWIIDEIVKRINGRFHLYSEGCYYQREFQKVVSGSCGYWQGTIIYLSLPLNNPVTLSDIEKLKESDLSSLKINWS